TLPHSPVEARFVCHMNSIPATAQEQTGRGRVGETELRYASTERFSAGTPVTLAIRPEEIVIGPAARDAENRLLTRVRGVQFLGPFTRLSLALPGGPGAGLECDVAANALAEIAAADRAALLLRLRPEAPRVLGGEG